jgi:fibronectin type 3 domain-containing protein
VSGVTFPVTLTSGQTETLNVQFDPTATGAATGQLTISSNSSTNSTTVIALSGTGTTATYAVNLSWDAPTSSADPVAGYNVYRALSGSSTYILLNSSIDAETSYVDSTVVSGHTYDYTAESVDASGVESVPSNVFCVTIP